MHLHQISLVDRMALVFYNLYVLHCFEFFTAKTRVEKNNELSHVLFYYFCCLQKPTQIKA